MTDTNTSPPPKVTLYRGFPPLPKYTWSPFVTKLEFRLRHAKLAYTIQQGSTSEGPNGKVPYIDIAPLLYPTSPPAERHLLADSSLIISSLTHLSPSSSTDTNPDPDTSTDAFSSSATSPALPDVNAQLSSTQLTQDLGLRALLEEKLYFLNMSERWLDNHALQRDHILAHLSWTPLRALVGLLIRRKIVNTLFLQGCGRLTAGQQRAAREEIWLALEGMMRERKLDAHHGGRKEEKKIAAETDQSVPPPSYYYCWWLLGGEEPTEADFVCYAFLSSVLVCESCPESTAFVKENCPVLVEWAEMIHRGWFVDYEKWN